MTKRADHPIVRYPATRRALVKTGVVAGLGVGAVAFVGSRRQSPQATANESEGACVLTPELMEGPFYVPEELIRQDITEGKPGLPLELRINVQDVASCGPLANAAVDIWHCDADGYYSGVEGANPGDLDSVTTTQDNANTTFMRGVQITDADGLAVFKTIYPGWYRGRPIHIHLKVIVDGVPKPADEESINAGKGDVYDGGRHAHTGQLFFDENVSEEVAKLEPYASRGTERTRLEGDRFLEGHSAEEPGFMLDLVRVEESDLSRGLIGSVTLSVNAKQD